MAAIQSYFRCNGDDEYSGEKAHRYGTLPSNQRIKCWWFYLRKNCSNWWINFFKDLIEAGHLSLSNQLQKECLWCCFNKVLQADLTSVQLHWNSHYMQKSRFDTISGRLDELYFLPECSATNNYIKSVTDEQFEYMSHCHEYNDDNYYQEYLSEICQQLNVGESLNWRECLNLYYRLCQIAEGQNS